MASKTITLFELGYFTPQEAQKICELLDRSDFTYMNFYLSFSNQCGNCLLIIHTDYKASAKEIKEFFFSFAFRKLYDISKAYNALLEG